VGYSFNTDQVSQFTSDGFIAALQAAGTHISMESKGGWSDNVMIERVRCCLKYKCVYLHAFAEGRGLRQGLKQWNDYYKSKRPHSSLDSRTSDEAYVATPSTRLQQRPGPGPGG
jgi:putative transposase